MFGKQLNRSNNCYLSQVAMIESKCQKPETSFRKKVNMPATVFTKSPIKDRQNKSIVGNTPSRKTQLSRVTLGATDDPSRRTSISPLKNRRQQLLGQQQPTNTSNVFLEQNSSFIQTQPQAINQLQQANYSSGRVSQQPTLSSSINSQIQRSKRVDSCQNHSNKPAKYFISIDEEDLPYCEKCAILLASQGFKVSKCDQVAEVDNLNTTLTGVAAVSNGPLFSQVSQQNHTSLFGDHSHPRRQEINNFLGELQSVMQSLALRRSETEQSAAKADFQYHDENTKLSAFYQQITDEIVNHKKVIQAAVAEQHTHTMKEFSTRLSSVDEAISDSKMMKDDILSSLDLIKQAEEKDYRPIMESYKENARKFKQVSQKSNSHNGGGDIKFAFGDYNEPLRRFLQDFTAVLTGETSYQAPQPKQDISGHSSINFSFEGRTHDEMQRERQHQMRTKPQKDIQCLPGPLSQDENPIELLSQEDLSRERFMKSSLKDHKGLFSEFDDFGA